MTSRRVKRWMFVLCSLLTIALCLLMCLSRYWTTSLNHDSSAAFRNLSIAHGALFYEWDVRRGRGYGWSAFGRPIGGDEEWPISQRLLPGCESSSGYFCVHGPLWPFAIPSLFAVILLRREVKWRDGHCVCGYCLTGLLPGCFCPECGKTIPGERKLQQKRSWLTHQAHRRVQWAMATMCGIIGLGSTALAVTSYSRAPFAGQYGKQCNWGISAKIGAVHIWERASINVVVPLTWGVFRLKKSDRDALGTHILPEFKLSSEEKYVLVPLWLLAAPSLTASAWLGHRLHSAKAKSAAQP